MIGERNIINCCAVCSGGDHVKIHKLTKCIHVHEDQAVIHSVSKSKETCEGVAVGVSSCFFWNVRVCLSVFTHP